MIDIIPNWHPIFVHFTVALLSTASVLFTVSIILPEFQYKEQVIIVARWNLWMGSFITIVTLLAGWQAYNTVFHDAPSHVAMTNHRNWALITASLFFVLAAWQLKCRLQKYIRLSFVIAMLIAFSFLLTTAYKGGELVYRYGLGVMSLPTTEEHGQLKSSGHSYDGGATHQSKQQQPKSIDPSDSMDHKPMNNNNDGHDHEH